MLSPIGLGPHNTYVANIIKCRPPDNRNPEVDEIEACGEYLKKQIESIKPKFIIATGKFSTMWLLETKEEIKITKYVGKKLDYKGIPFMPIFHPAYLLRNPEMKSWTWDHLKEIYEILDKLGIYE